MKKITLIAALLGSAYFANAQVGIGTPTPNASSMLDVTASNKGVLIPRVALENTKTEMTGNSDQPESLLVYNTATTTGVDLVTPGFYYWVPLNGTVAAHWERVVNQSQLNEIIANQTDIEKIKILLNAAYGSNNLGDSATNGVFGGMVFTPATGTFGDTNYVAPVVEYVKWDPAANGYVKVNVTSQLIDLIKGNETETKIVNIGGNTYYISESFVGTEPTTAAAFELAASDATTGIYKIDFVNGVAKNFQEISTTVTNILKPNSTTEFFTVQEYIKYLSQNSQLTGDTKIVIDATSGKASLQQWDGTAWVAVNNSAFSTIVTDNETDTQITKNTTGTAAAGTIKIDYKYFNEAQPLVSGAEQQIIDVNADLKTLIEGNTEIKKAIQNILNAGVSVYYTETEITAANNFGTLVPAKTLYIIKKDGSGNDVKTPIDISGTVITAITNNSEIVKNILGDNFNTTTIVNTGDVWNDGKQIYKGIFDAFVINGSANVVKVATDSDYSEITLAGAVGDVINITVLNSNGNKITSAVTDVVTTATGVKFRIGTGTMYNVLFTGTGATAVKVLVEFSSTVTP